MAEEAISSLVKLLGDEVIQRVKSLQGVKQQVVLLKQELERMQAFLVDANKRQYREERVRQWISEIRELAQDAQDTLEMFVINVENKRNDGLLKKCITFPKCVKHLYLIEHEIASILQRLEAIKRSRDTYGIRDLGEAAAVSATHVELRRRQIEPHPVGQEEDERMLLQKSILNEECSGLSIAVVEGMGGIGKSTLARKIYNHPDVVGGRFECRAWVVVSRECTPQETIKQLILELAGPEKDSLGEDCTDDKLYLHEKLQQMLHQQLLEKTYFIVLDDLWEEQHWEDLKDAFPASQQDQYLHKRSRLLFTTRNRRLKKYGQYGHEMKVLNPDRSWELLMNKTLLDGKCSQKLEGVGRQILKKCQGLPLAIRVVGGLLVGTQSKSDWEQVLDQINSFWGIHDESSIFSILELSYQNLSPRLKSCFLCLAFFKEDAIISVRRLTHIWVGQDLIQQEGRRRTSDEIARSYLDELITRNLVQIKDFTLDCHVKKCQVHDLVREVCLKKAKEEIGLEILKVQERPTSTPVESSLRKPRHCVAYSGNMGCFSLENKRRLRSLFLVHEYNGSIDHEFGYCKRFQLLKILSLEWFGLSRLPCCFRTLVGLKYLKIKDVCKLHLPRWLEELKNLEVVDLRDQPVVFPKGELKMESLRYFRACYVSGEMTRIKGWKNIETLKYIGADQWMICSSGLIGSHPLCELGIDLNKSQLYEMIMVQESLKKMENLAKLHLFWSTINCPIDLALLILQVGSGLTKLTLVGSMFELPNANVFPPKLTHLTLDKSRLLDDSMTELGKLPNLISLKLSSDAYGGERMKVLHDGFPSLEALSLIFITSLRGIDIEEGGMPNLTHLRLQECDALSIENLPKHIIITNVNC